MSNILYNFLNKSFLSNTIISYIYSIIVYILAINILFFLRERIFYKLEILAQKTKTNIDDLIIALIKKIKNPEYQLIAFYIATRNLDKAFWFDYTLKIILLLVITYRVLTIIEELFSYWISTLESKEEQPIAALSSVKIIFKVIIWIIAILFILHNAGVKIGALIASLGIGGVAIALASQTILGDIFNFFVILLDKPFKKGDFIVLAGNISGTVEEIGLKSTKIRSLQGEIISVTNTKVFSDIIQNYALMKERRVVNTIGVIYQTPPEKLEKIKDIIKKCIEKAEKTRFDRANLVKLNSSSIDFEFVYYILDPDYSVYIKTQEKIIMEIIKEFLNEGINFAYPTQTLFIEKKEGL